MSTARALEWAKQVGLRKIVGASRAQLVTQHLLNTTLLTIIGTALAITLLQMLVPFFNALISLDLDLAFYVQGQPNKLLFYLG